MIVCVSMQVQTVSKFIGHKLHPKVNVFWLMHAKDKRIAIGRETLESTVKKKT